MAFLIHDPRPLMNTRQDGNMTSITHLVNNCKIIVDESFLLDANGRACLQQYFLPAFIKGDADRKLVLPARVDDYLTSLANDPQSPHQTALADIQTLIHAFDQSQRIKKLGDEDELSGSKANTADLFTRLVCRFQLKFELAFLTADADCARALLMSNSTGSINHAKRVHVLMADPQTCEPVRWTTDVPGDNTRQHHFPRTLDLADLSNRGRIIIDTSALMTDRSEPFVYLSLMPALRQSGKQVLVSHRVVHELQHHVQTTASAVDADSVQRGQSAHTGLKLIQALQTEQLADFRGEENELAGNYRFFDPVVLDVFTRHQKNTQLLLITEDRNLACQILDNATNLNATEFPPQVGYIDVKDKQGKTLGNWAARRLWSKYQQASSQVSQPGDERTERKRASDRIKPFSLAHDVYRGSTDVMQVSSIPASGDMVSGDVSGSFQIGERISEGGEGIIYKTSLPDMVCKIYLQERLTHDRLKKLERMTSRRSPAPGICWPCELVRNRDGEFIGYLMPMAKGEIFNLSVFKKPLLEEMFPHWQREHLVQLAITTLTLIQKLHQLNVLIGDINPNNFMVVNEHEVYLVDTDSFQVEEFPCPVGTPQFTAPELIGLPYNSFLRTKENEMFAVATMLFMILFVGKAPFSGQGAGDIIESIKKHQFPYVAEDSEKSSRPFGPYKFIWSNLYNFLRNDFKEIFHLGQSVPDANPQGRGNFRQADNYLDLFLIDLKGYLAKIRKGDLSNDLFPKENHFRPNEKTVTVPCCEPGCKDISVFTTEYYNSHMAQKKNGVRCSKHHQIHQFSYNTRKNRTSGTAATTPRRWVASHSTASRHSLAPVTANKLSVGRIAAGIVLGISALFGSYQLIPVVMKLVAPQEAVVNQPAPQTTQPVQNESPETGKKPTKSRHKHHHHVVRKSKPVEPPAPVAEPSAPVAKPLTTPEDAGQTDYSHLSDPAQ